MTFPYIDGQNRGYSKEIYFEDTWRMGLLIWGPGIADYKRCGDGSDTDAML